MKYCTKCGHELQNDAILCPNCGCLVQAEKAVEKVEEKKTGSLNINFSLFLGIYVLFDVLILWIMALKSDSTFYYQYYFTVSTALSDAIIVVFCILNAVPDLKSKSNKNICTLLGFVFSIASIVLLLAGFVVGRIFA